MNREFVLTEFQRDMLSLYVDSTKYPTSRLQLYLWDVIIEDYEDMRYFGEIWRETIDCESCSFDIIDNKLTIYDTDNN